jgi:hypothetical protein
MATKKKENKATVLTSATQLVAGVNKRFATGTQVSFAGGSYTPAQITSKLQALVTLRTDVDTAKASTKAKLAAESADAPPLRTFMSALVAYVKAVYGTQPDVLADFGLTPKAPRTPPTIEDRATAAAKRTATRAARHTMGSKQKTAVKGAVTGVTITPVSALQPVVATPPGVPSAGATSTAATAATAPSKPAP